MANSRQYRSAKMALPCRLPCPKCGSSDISRRHLPPGPADPIPSPMKDARSSGFIDRSDRWTLNVLKECIAHHCRVCGYYWDTACLPDSAGSVKEFLTELSKGPRG